MVEHLTELHSSVGRKVEHKSDELEYILGEKTSKQSVEGAARLLFAA